MSSRIARVIAVVALAGVLLAPTESALAYPTPPEGTGGNIGYSWTWFGYKRQITNSAAPGPAIAFYYSGGPSGLTMGPWNCMNNNLLWGFNTQAVGVWNYVADGLGDGQVFCMAVRADYSGYFGGTLDWD
ncbi:MAG: hypothetical protein QM589_17755 [Thermomicrobiales bacterium]